MTSPLDDPQVRSYLAALEDRLAQMHAEQSEEILTGIAEHITLSSGQGGRPVPEVLTSLGTPEDVVAGAAPWPAGCAALPPAQPAASQPWQASTLWVAVTCILLPFGGFLAGVGWLFGVAGLWMGTRWKLWEKIMGTVLIPGGLPGVLLLATTGVRETVSSSGTAGDVIISDHNPLGISLPEQSFIVALALPIIVALYLLAVALVRGARRPQTNPVTSRPRHAAQLTHEFTRDH